MNIGDISMRIGFDFKVFLFNLINFIILALLLKKFFFEKIMTIMAEREDQINKGLHLKELAQKELDAISAKRDEVLAEAMNTAQTIVTNARNTSKHESERIKNEAFEEINKARRHYLKELEAEKMQMLNEFKEKSADVIVTAVKSIISENKLN